ncbi:MAG TPA: beta-galactosidase [Opitutaceae bacterium]|nr:beta-galactosidase [Opitutaceae bacterium]
MKRLYHGAAYYPELWPAADMARDISEMRRLGINVVRMGDFAWSTMEPNEGEISLDFFRQVMDRLHEAEIAVVFCTPTASPPVWLTHGHPERWFVGESGRPMSHGSRQHVSYEHPAVRSACVRIAEACARELGHHPALIAWQIDNEFKCHVAEDFSAPAIEAWHGWLARRYGTIQNLNTAWGTDVWSHRYQSFEQVPAPVAAPFLHSASLSTAFRMFSRERIAEFMEEQCAAIRRHSAAPITHNFGLTFSVNFERMARDLGFVSFDDYPSSANWAHLVFDCDIFRAAKPGRAFWLMETSVSHNGWLGNNEPPHPRGFLRAEAVATYALGGEAFCYWLWRQPRTGAELPHSAVMTPWFKPSIGYESVREVEYARAALEPLLTQCRPAPAEVALIWSDLGRAMMQTEPLGARTGYTVDYLATLRCWHRAVVDLGLHRDVRFEGAPLDGVKLLITPLMPHVSPAFLKKAEEFVRGGGVWLCLPITGTRAPEHAAQTEAALGEIEKLAGVQTAFAYPITDTGATGTAFDVTVELAGWCCALRSENSNTDTLGTIRTDRLPPGLAFLTQTRLGAGWIVLLGAEPRGGGEHELRQRLIEHCAKLAALRRRFDVTPGIVVGPRALSNGRERWVVVDLEGKGGVLRLPTDATDAVSNRVVKKGAVEIAPYDWRAFDL